MTTEQSNEQSMTDSKKPKHKSASRKNTTLDFPQVKAIHCYYRANTQFNIKPQIDRQQCWKWHCIWLTPAGWGWYCWFGRRRRRRVGGSTWIACLTHTHTQTHTHTNTLPSSLSTLLSASSGCFHQQVPSSGFKHIPLCSHRDATCFYGGRGIANICMFYCTQKNTWLVNGNDLENCHWNGVQKGLPSHHRPNWKSTTET